MVESAPARRYYEDLTPADMAAIVNNHARMADIDVVQLAAELVLASSDDDGNDNDRTDAPPPRSPARQPPLAPAGRKRGAAPTAKECAWKSVLRVCAMCRLRGAAQMSFLPIPMGPPRQVHAVSPPYLHAEAVQGESRAGMSGC